MLHVRQREDVITDHFLSLQVDTFRITPSRPGRDGVGVEPDYEPSPRGVLWTLKEKAIQLMRKKRTGKVVPVPTNDTLKINVLAIVRAQAMARGMITRNHIRRTRTWFEELLSVSQCPVKYLVREMKSIANEARVKQIAVEVLVNRLKPKDIVLALGAPGHETVLAECEIIEKGTKKKNKIDQYRLRFLLIGHFEAWVKRQDIKYVCVKHADYLHQDPLWRSALEVMVRSPFMPSLHSLAVLKYGQKNAAPFVSELKLCEAVNVYYHCLYFYSDVCMCTHTHRASCQ